MKTKKRKTVARTKKETRYVAIVVDADLTKILSNRNSGDWSAFFGTDRDEVAELAVKARAKWTASGNYGPYRILLGTLTEEVQTPSNFKVVKL